MIRESLKDCSYTPDFKPSSIIRWRSQIRSCVPRGVPICRQGPWEVGKPRGGVLFLSRVPSCLRSCAITWPACLDSWLWLLWEQCKEGRCHIPLGSKAQPSNARSPCWQREKWRVWKQRLGECKGLWKPLNSLVWFRKWGPEKFCDFLGPIGKLMADPRLEFSNS